MLLLLKRLLLPLHHLHGWLGLPPPPYVKSDHPLVGSDLAPRWRRGAEPPKVVVEREEPPWRRRSKGYLEILLSSTFLFKDFWREEMNVNNECS